MVRGTVKSYGVESIKYLGEESWKVKWSCGSTTTEPSENLTGISTAVLRHAEGVDQPVFTAVRAIRACDDDVQIYSNGRWHDGVREQVLPETWQEYLNEPREKKNSHGGVQFVTTSSQALSCGPYAVLRAFPELEPYEAEFLRFAGGVSAGNFVTWLINHSFGTFKLIAKKQKLNKSGMFDFLTSDKRRAGKKYLVRIHPTHLITVHIGMNRSIIHCAKRPGSALTLTWANYQTCGGSKNYPAKCWKLNLTSTE